MNEAIKARFFNKNGTKFFDYDLQAIPRIGDHVALHSGSGNSIQSKMEGEVIQVVWNITDLHEESAVFIIIEEEKIPDEYV